ncbi:hypothetical protein NP493_396g00006 [Ridgeia piscesae]|uniref:Uncharacterized protein n=1 Tax=Ridgeia piscesae TaxID=27915 RepID=A0AAD9NT70_RIDPI|nr:hypothetical protein NP493_396g00006 [Ridgeia piscesae]
MHYYTLNMVPGVKLSDEAMKSICVPRVELGTHITMKMSQAFTVLGVGLIGPMVAVVKGNQDLKGITQSSFACGHFGLMAGLTLGPVSAGAFMWNKSKDAIYDRCYRLRSNKNQLRVDQLSILGTLAGVGIAYHFGDVLEKGAVFGLAGGCLLGGFVNQVLRML